MRIVSGIDGSAVFSPRTSRRRSGETRIAAPTEARALIPLEPAAASEHATGTERRPLAVFLAHLIATQTGAPQTRTRRRTEPGEAASAYAAAKALGRRH